ncbi:MAG: hypothetical protein LBN10_10010 [Propionibacteriaceae bacterium]|nr:hypothetical protein [Propionibacteriaceae bacterium]
MTDDKHIPVLSETEQARWDVVCSGIRAIADEIVEGTLTETSLEAGLNQLKQVKIDTARILDSLHVPEDAGEYGESITAILLRIPDSWGRWLSCDAGWYPLITKLDADLAALAPDYVVHQVKEKFGTLRYYAELPSVADPQCCEHWKVEHPRPNQEDRAALDEWIVLFEMHDETPEHMALMDAAYDSWVTRHEALQPRFTELIRTAEEASATTCELCGQTGSMKSRRSWYKTLCDECALQGGWS